MTKPPSPGALETVPAYHARTKHRVGHCARSFGYMDWNRQPDAFRTYQGAGLFPLDEISPTSEPFHGTTFEPACKGSRFKTDV